MSNPPVSGDRSTLALAVMHAALSLAVKKFADPAHEIADADIERAAELFDVGGEVSAIIVRHPKPTH